MKSLFNVGLVLFSLLQYKIWWAPGNITELLEFKQTISEMRQKNEKFKIRNTVLDLEIDSLKHSKVAEEERARNELGMIKEGEIFYNIIED